MASLTGAASCHLMPINPEKNINTLTDFEPTLCIEESRLFSNKSANRMDFSDTWSSKSNGATFCHVKKINVFDLLNLVTTINPQ